MMKSLGEGDFSAQETMHHLLSLKLHSTTFHVKSFSLNGSRRLQKSGDAKNKNCTGDSFLDVYANRKIFSNKFPDIMKTNFLEFATKCKLTKMCYHCNNRKSCIQHQRGNSSVGANFFSFCFSFSHLLVIVYSFSFCSGISLITLLCYVLYVNFVIVYYLALILLPVFTELLV